MSAPDVSVVVPTYEHPDQLERLLAGLDVQTLPADRFEVVVADDGSARPPAPSPRAYRLTVVRQEDLGFRAAAARNLGARSARGRVLAFLDQDVVPSPEYLARVAAAVDHPWSLVVGRRRHADLDGWGASAVGAWLTGSGPAPRLLPEPRWLEDGYARTAGLTRPDDRAYRLVISAVLSVHRDLFARLGGFDATLVGYGGEDWELAHRAYVAGADLRYVADAVAWHDGPDAAGRPADLTAVKNRETLAVARRLPDPGLRGRSFVWRVPETVVVVHGADAGAAALAACTESLLRHPDVGVWLPASAAAEAVVAALDDPRVHTGPVPGEVVARARYRVTMPVVSLTGAGLAGVLAAVPTASGGVEVRRARDLNRQARGCPPEPPEPWPADVAVEPIEQEPFLERLWEKGVRPCR